MAPLYAYKYREEIFGKRNFSYILRFGIGSFWALFLFASMVSGGSHSPATAHAMQRVDHNEIAYVKALDLLKAGKDEAAIASFEKLGSYRDSQKRLADLRAKSDTEKEQAYKAAIELARRSECKEAQVIFKRLGDYKDAQSRIKACAQPAKTGTLEQLKGDCYEKDCDACMKLANLIKYDVSALDIYRKICAGGCPIGCAMVSMLVGSPCRSSKKGKCYYFPEEARQRRHE